MERRSKEFYESPLTTVVEVEQEGSYWTSTEEEEDASFAYIYVFDGDYSLNAYNFAHKDDMLAVRPIQD
jgi:hypothetical protein